jgi:K+-sensing histidine kinase KdpD
MDYFNYNRRQSSVVQIGNKQLGGNNPILIQSMANVSTLDTNACVEQAIRIIDAGADYVRFTAKGYIEIGYELSADGKSILISVKDTGKGIPDDKKEKVFERFQKLDEFAQGTGLGLAICQSIVHTFHGSISLESEVGVGSKFTISLPYTPGLELEERT